MTVELSPGIELPTRSRTFTPETVQQVWDYLNGTAEGQDGTPVERIGYGVFDKPGGARSAGETLNRLLKEKGATHKYSVGVYPRDDKFVGVLFNRPAKVRPPSAKKKK